MAYTLTDGVLGLEGIHTFSPRRLAVFDTIPPALPDFSMHGQHRRDLGAWVKLDQLVGFHGLPDWEPAGADAEGRMGRVRYPALQKSKSFTYNGRLCAMTLPGLRALEASLQASLAAREGVLTSAPHPLYGAGGYYTDVRVVDFDADDDQTRPATALPTPWQREFALGLEMPHPRWKWVTLSVVSGQVGSAVVTNLGRAQAEPKITVYGHSGALTIRNATTGRKLVFAGLPVADAGWGRVAADSGQRSVILPTQADIDSPNTSALRYLTFEESDWWDAQADATLTGGLLPGANTIEVVGTHSSFKVEWRHSTW